MSHEDLSNKRMGRVEREVREVVAGLLISDFRSSQPGLLTVSRVWVSKDLKLGRVYVSFMPVGESPDPKAPKIVIKELNQEAFEFQRAIGKELKMRYTPKLEFFIDDTLDESLRVQGMIRKIEEERKQKESPSTPDASQTDDEE
jgi:ribosome-binding factor A